VKQDGLDADEIGEGEFFSWEVINVYGSVKKELKSSFL
jgi:hypothetical protein